MNTLLTDLPGVLLLETDRRSDERGGFARWFCESDLAAALQGATIRQINHSHTVQRGSVRGMHFQYAPHAEKKIIRCLSGKIFDVVVDLRKDSATFLAWRGFELEAGDDRALLIPEGCAHGFQTLSNEVQMLYLHTAFYTPAAEGAVRFDDPRIAIDWPLPPQNLSERDLLHPFLSSDFSGISL
ncbi:dTDP-4-dehydrorhamnose 3,5-epimerase family protein [Herbaspirillum lusitanum]|jgi:dTDP-4-dehydrorhamnose 3,5-epimerase|uniref:dTDP-4-dehydrorhamnose 3,5-epimerase n=1 Tax=Herbaspirillum lusitanum TaxID=213312 RepID=A0ABW9ADP9_9BURK